MYGRRKISHFVLINLWLSASILVLSSKASAEEFDDILVDAIENGTQVNAAESRRDAADAAVRRAWSKFLPSIRATGEFGDVKVNPYGASTQGKNHFNNETYGISATLPIFKGGRNYYGLGEARESARSERHELEHTRQILLIDTVRAILGIIRDREIVALQARNARIVQSILQTTLRRFEGGEATRTDIALANDQLVAAKSVLTQARNNLRSNEIEFEKLVGRKPGRLKLPRGLAARLPRSLNEAIEMAEQQNPQLLSSIARSRAADLAVRSSYSAFLPSVDLNVDYEDERYNKIGTLNDSNDLSVKLNVSVPLFTPSAIPETQISRARAKQRQHEMRDTRLTVSAMTQIAWRSYHTAKRRYTLAGKRIAAAIQASRGIKRELAAGQRTVLDVLDTQERVVQAKLEAANAKYERYMSAYLLLASVGQLSVQSSNLDDLPDYYSNRMRQNNITGSLPRGKKTVSKKSRWKTKLSQGAAPKWPNQKTRNVKNEVLPWKKKQKKNSKRKLNRSYNKANSWNTRVVPSVSRQPRSRIKSLGTYKSPSRVRMAAAPRTSPRTRPKSAQGLNGFFSSLAKFFGLSNNHRPTPSSSPAPVSNNQIYTSSNHRVKTVANRNWAQKTKVNRTRYQKQSVNRPREILPWKRREQVITGSIGRRQVKPTVRRKYNPHKPKQALIKPKYNARKATSQIARRKTIKRKTRYIARFSKNKRLTYQLGKTGFSSTADWHKMQKQAGWQHSFQ